MATRSSIGQNITRSTAPLFLTNSQLKTWTSTGATASASNVSTVPLKTRYNISSAQFNPNLSFNFKVDWCPDGVDRWSNYINEVAKFNTYNFTNWQYIDKYTWFSNNANGTYIPPKSLVEAAHKHGVKVLGTVFFADATAFNDFLTGQTNGYYTSAVKLVEIANYYGFDGFFFNIETSTTSTNANIMKTIMTQMQTLKPAGMEVNWYDAILNTGSLSWQNALNTSNSGFFQSGTTRVSDEFFTNYGWSSTQVTTSVNTAQSLGRSAFDVFMGADGWPDRNAQNPFNNPTFIDALFNGSPTAPKASLAPFAWANVAYEHSSGSNFVNDPADYDRYYNTDARFFAGDDMNCATTGTGWKGLSYYMPVRTVIGALPFETSFNVGQGRIWANAGVQTVRDWSDAAKQDIQPSWQWAIEGTAAITPRFDFQTAYNGGSSIKLTGSINNNAATVKLYQTQLSITSNSVFDVTFKLNTIGASNAKLLLYFSNSLSTPVEMDLGSVSNTGWNTVSLNLSAHAGKVLNIIGIKVGASTAVASYQMNLGKFKIYNATGTSAPIANFTPSATTITAGQSITFTDASSYATTYAWSFPGGTPSTSTAPSPTVTFSTAGTYTVSQTVSNSTGSNTKSVTITVTQPATTNTSFALDGVGRYGQGPAITLSGSAVTLECWVRVNAFKTSTPYISAVMGEEVTGSSTALLRFGDANIAANKLQFVLQFASTQVKLTSNTSFATNTWYHVAATYDGAAMRIYVNGVLDASVARTGSFTANTPFFLGYSFNNTRILNGNLENVRVWNRSLSATEIQSYRCTDVAANATGLQAFWKMNNTSNSIADFSVNNRTAAVQSYSATATWSTNVPACIAVNPSGDIVNRKMIGTPEKQLEEDVLIYPNPLEGNVLNIRMSSSSDTNGEIYLYDVNGRLVEVKNTFLNRGENNVQVDLSQRLTSGQVYIVKIVEHTNTYLRKLLVH